MVISHKKNYYSLLILFVLTLSGFAKESLCACSSFVSYAKLNSYTIGDRIPNTISHTPYIKGEIIGKEGQEGLIPYHFQFTFPMPTDLPKEEAVLYLSSVQHPYYLYVNDMLLSRLGFGDKSQTLRNYSSQIITLDRKLLEKDAIVVDYIVFVNAKGFTPPNLLLGSYSSLTKRSFWKTFLNHEIVVGISLFAFLVSFVFLSLSAASGFSNKEYNFFSMFCISISLCYLMNIFNSPTNDELLLFRVSRISFSLTAFGLFRFIQIHAGIKLHRLFDLFLWGVTFTVIIALGTTTTRMDIYERFSIVFPFYICPLLFSALVIIIYCLIKGIKRPLSFILFVSLLIIHIFSIHDFIAANKASDPFFWLIPHAYLLSYMSVMGILFWKQNREHQLKIEQQEQLIELNQIAESSIKAKESFIKNVSHEFKTPLNGIKGSIELLYDDLKENYRGGIGHLDNLRSSFERLFISINNILDYNRIMHEEDERLFLRTQKFAISSLIDPMIEAFHHGAIEKNISFEISSSVKEWQEIVGDKDKILQLLFNLIENAIKFTERGGVFVDISLQGKKKPFLVCLIKDTGIGMSQTFKNKAFELFTSHETEFTKVYEGLGIGLALTSKIAGIMQCGIELESEQGIGTEYQIKIPVSFPSDSDGDIDRDYMVLVVEDNRVNNHILVKLLEKLGVTAIAAFNGKEAVEICKNHSFSLILMDVQMPIMNGLTATTIIRTMPTFSNTPIIAVTANANEKECEKAGMTGYIPKPVGGEDIKALIDQYVQV